MDHPPTARCRLPLALALIALPGATTLFAGEPSVLRYTYMTESRAGPSPSFYSGGAITVEATVFRTNDFFNGSTIIRLPYADGYSPVAAIEAGSSEENGDAVELAFTTPEGFCCVHVAAHHTTIPLRSWTHVAATLEGTTARLYLGGSEIASNLKILGMPPVSEVMSPLSIGRFFPGAIRDVRVWTRALSAAEIAVSAGGGLPATTGLVAAWALDDGAGQEASDSGPSSIPLVLGLSPDADPGDPNWLPESFLTDGPFFDLRYTKHATTVDGFVEPIVADPNRDGFLDVFYVAGFPIARYTCDWPYYEGAPPPQLPPLRNNGDGTFTEDPTLVEYEYFAHGFKHLHGEFTGDAYPDVFVNDTGPEFEFIMDCPPSGLGPEEWPGGRPRLFVGTAEGVLVEESSARLPDIIGFAHAPAAGDIDGDDDLDLFLNFGDSADQNDCFTANFYPGVGCPLIFVNDGSGHFTWDYTRLPLSVSTRLDGKGNAVHYQTALMLDVDRDDDFDIFLGGPGGGPVLEAADVILVNDGTGHFVRAPETVMPPRPGGNDGTFFAIAADLNRDGSDDIIGSQAYNLPLYWANGDGTFRVGAPQLQSVPGLGYGPCQPADLNADGWLDLACFNAIGPRFYYNLGNESFAALPVEYDYGLTDAGRPGRVDDDDLVDILVGSGGRSQFFRQVKPYFPPNAVGVFAHGFESDETGLWSVPPPP